MVQVAQVLKVVKMIRIVGVAQVIQVFRVVKMISLDEMHSGFSWSIKLTSRGAERRTNGKWKIVQYSSRPETAIFETSY